MRWYAQHLCAVWVAFLLLVISFAAAAPAIHTESLPPQDAARLAYENFPSLDTRGSATGTIAWPRQVTLGQESAESEDTVSESRSSENNDVFEFTFNLGDLLAPFIGSLLGVALGLYARSWWENRKEKESLQKALDMLRIEIEKIRGRSQEWAAENVSKDDVSIRANLPTQAWQQFVAQGAHLELSEQERRHLIELYHLVETANTGSAHIPLLLQTATLSDKSHVQDGFFEQAIRFGQEPYKDVTEAASNSLTELSEKI